MAEKQNDMVLNILSNPTFSVSDFQQVGLTADNTELLDEQKYLSSSSIQQNPMFKDANGNFDPARFHQVYTLAGAYYNSLATQNPQDKLLSTVYSSDNIFAPAQAQKIDERPEFITYSNPFLQDRSLTRIGKLGPRTKSISEIAQSQKIFDTATGTYKEDTVNDRTLESGPGKWLSDFFSDPLVIAQWDEDGEHVDPLTGQKQKHTKGEYKMNDEGTFYYETLNGRDIAGRQVLNKLDTLTVDGSSINKYDFFDSDDLQGKSAFGSIMKNLALVGSMWLPYVGPAVIAATLATSLTDVAGALGKMALGSDVPVLNNVQGWARSLQTHNVTEYAQNNTWCWENVINTVGDMASLMYATKFIHKYSPAVFKGTKGVKLQDPEYYQKAIQELAAKRSTETLAKLQPRVAAGEMLDVDLQGVLAANQLRAGKEISQYLQSYQKLGGNLATSYFVATSIPGVYEQAKLAGAEDWAATAYSLGYGAASFTLMRAGIGKMLMPELQMDKIRFKALTDVVTKEMSSSLNGLSGAEAQAVKQGWFKKVFNMGKRAANADLVMDKYKKAVEGISIGKIGMAGAHMGAAGVEMMSFDLLHDFSASCYNLAAWMGGSDSRLDAWHNMFDRYAMSFIGGAVNGGLGTFGQQGMLKQIENAGKINSETAMQEIAYMINNGTIGKYKDFLKKTDLGYRNLSSKVLAETKEGNIYAEGTKTDNQDREIKKTLLNQIELIENVLDAEGAKVPEYLLSDILTEKDLRFQMLKDTSTLGLYLQEYNSICSDMAKVALKMQEVRKANPDQKSQWTEAANREMEGLEQKMSALRIKKDSFLTGKKNPSFIQAALFEASPVLHRPFSGYIFSTWVEKTSGKRYDELTADEIASYREKYKVYRDTEMKNDAKGNSDLLVSMMHLASGAIQNQTEYAQKLQSEHGDIARGVQFWLDHYFETATHPAAMADEDAWLNTLQQTLGNAGETRIIQDKITVPFISADAINRLRTISQREVTDTYTLEQKNLDYANVLNEETINYLDTSVQHFVNLGYIHSESKNAIVHSLKQLSGYFDAKYNIANDMMGQLGEMGMPGEEVLSAYNKVFGTHYTETDAINHISEVIDQSTRSKQAVDQLKEAQNKLNQLAHTPIVQSLEQFKLAVSNSSLNVTEAMEKVNTLINQNRGDLTNFNMGPDFAAQLGELSELLDVYQAAIYGSRVDKSSMSNLWGYSKTLNELNRKAGNNEWVPLAEIEGTTADLFLQDIQLLRNKVKFAQELHRVNSGQKLNLQNKVGLNHTYIRYNRFKTFADQVKRTLTDWNTDSLDQALVRIDQDGVLDEFAGDTVADRRFNLDFNQRVQVEKDKLAMEDAIFKFFEDNRALLDNPDKLAELINPDFFNMYDPASELLSDTTERLDDNSFIWDMAARAAMKSSAFYKVFKDLITTDKAPIPTQESAVYLNVAMVMNGDMIKKFAKAYSKSLYNHFLGMDEQGRFNKLKQLGFSDSLARGMAKEDLEIMKSENFIDKLTNFILTEGIPGSGKSGGVINMTKKVLEKLHPDSLKNVYYVHSTEANAQKAIEDIGMTGAKAFDKDGFIHTIDPGFKSKDENGLYDPSDYEFKDGQVINKNALPALTPDNVPSLIIIDEVSRFDSVELARTQDFAAKHGIPVLAAGDFDQTSAQGKLQMKYKGKDEAFALRPERLFFPRASKFGVSLRTLNSQQTANLANAQAYLQNLRKTGDVSQPLVLHYFEDGDVIRGVKIIDRATNPEADIQKILNNLPEGEKLNYIYSDTNSATYKLLSTKYKDRVRLFKGSDAQGLEGSHYVVEIAHSDDSVSYLQDLYTGISRAEHGVLVIRDSGDAKFNIKSEKDTVSEEMSFSAEAIKKFSEKRKQLLDKVFENDTDVEDIPYRKMTAEEPETPTGSGTSENTRGTGDPKRTGGLPMPIPSDSNSERSVVGALSTRDAAELKVADLVTKYQKNSIIIDESGNELYKILDVSIREVKDDTQNTIGYLPVVIAEHEGTTREFTEDSLSRYTIKAPDTGNVIPPYNAGDKLIKTDDPSKTFTISDIKVKDGETEPTYYLVDDAGQTIEVPIKDIKDTYKTSNSVTVKSDESGTSLDTYTENLSRQELEAMTTDQNTRDLSERPHTPNAGSRNYDLSHWAYTFNTFETGARWDANGNMIPDNSGRAARRIDGVNGLMKIENLLQQSGRSLGLNTKADYIEMLASLRSVLMNTRDNSRIAERFKRILDLPDNETVSVEWALKSSAAPKAGEEWGITSTKNDPERFFKYEKHRDEKLEFMVSDDPNADVIPRKTLIALLKVGDGYMLEIPIAALNSPFTIAQETMGDQFVYPEIAARLGKWKSSQGTSTPELLDTAVQDCIALCKSLGYTDLGNLFELYRFTSNGINFVRDKDFSLASNESFGPAIYKTRGEYQLDGNLQFSGAHIDLPKFAHDPRVSISDVIIARDNIIGGKTVSELKPGYPFVFVSFDKDLRETADLAAEYEKQVKDARVPKRVGIFYIVPPEAGIRQFIDNKRAIGQARRNGQDVSKLQSIGDDFTSYRVLAELMSKPEVWAQIPEATTHHKRWAEEVINKLNSIEEKWESRTGLSQAESQEFQNLSNKYFDGSQYKASAPEKARADADRAAARALRIREQKSYLLETDPDKGALLTERSVMQPRSFLNSFLINAVYTVDNTGNPVFNPANMALIESNATLNGVRYKVRYKPNSDVLQGSVFVRAEVDGDAGDKRFTIQGKAFTINGKIDSPVFNMSTVINGLVASMAHNWAEDTRTGAKKLISRKEQDRYLGLEEPDGPEIVTMGIKFPEYFGPNGILTKFIDADTPFTPAAMNEAVAKFVSEPGHFATRLGPEGLLAVELPRGDYPVGMEDMTMLSKDGNKVSFADSQGAEHEFVFELKNTQSGQVVEFTETTTKPVESRHPIIESRSAAPVYTDDQWSFLSKNLPKIQKLQRKIDQLVNNFKDQASAEQWLRNIMGPQNRIGRRSLMNDLDAMIASSNTDGTVKDMLKSIRNAVEGKAAISVSTGDTIVDNAGGKSKVTSVDIQNRKITLEDGREVDFDGLTRDFKRLEEILKTCSNSFTVKI